MAPLGARRHNGVRVVPQLEHTWAVMTDAFFLRFGASVVAVGDVAGDAVGDIDAIATSFPFGDVDSFLTAAAGAALETGSAAAEGPVAATDCGTISTGGVWVGAGAKPSVCCCVTPSPCCSCCCCCSDTPSVTLPERNRSCVCCVCISVGGAAGCTGGII